MGTGKLKNLKRNEKGQFVSDIDFSDEQENEIVNRYRDGESSHEIAEDFDTSHTKILRVLRNAGQEIRSPGQKKADFPEWQIREMVEEYPRLSSTELAKRFGKCDKTVLKCLRENRIKIEPPGFEDGHKPWNYTERDIPNPWNDVDAAYVFGVLIGDGSIGYKYRLGKRRSADKVMLGTPDDQFATTFSKAVKLAFGIHVCKTSKTQSHCAMYSANSVDLGRAYDRFKWRTEIWRIPKPFFEVSRNIKVALCQGKADSDGKVEGKMLKVVSIHKPGLKDMLKIVESLGYNTSIGGPYDPNQPNKEKYYHLKIKKPSPELVRLPRKRKKL